MNVIVERSECPTGDTIKVDFDSSQHFTPRTFYSHFRDILISAMSGCNKVLSEDSSFRIDVINYNIGTKKSATLTVLLLGNRL